MIVYSRGLFMILSHQQGLSKVQLLRSKYDTELELMCLNSEYFDLTKLIPDATNLSEKYSDRVVFKKSEFHTKKNPYYEISLFCNQNELEEFKNIIKSINLEIDIIHDNK